MAGAFDGVIAAASRRYNVDPRLLRAVLHRESGIDPQAGASLPHDPDSPIGIGQLRPSTARGLGYADPRDPVQGIYAAAAYLDQGLGAAERGGVANPGAWAAAYYHNGPNSQNWDPKTTATYVQNVGAALRDSGYQPAGAGGPSGADGPGGADSTQPRLTVSPQVQAVRGGWQRVDPRLSDIVTRASGYLPDGWRAEVVSGYRPGDPLQHGKGDAVDVQLYDQGGQKVPNYQSPANFRTYEQFAQNARQVQTQLYPELNDQFQWGGYFHNGGMPKYGAADLMHLSIGDARAQAGDWRGGLNGLGKTAGFDAGGPPSQGMGDGYALPGAGQVAVVAHPSGKGVVATSLPDDAPLPNQPGLVYSGSSTAPRPPGGPGVPHPPAGGGVGPGDAPSWAGGDWGKLDGRADGGPPPSMAEAPPSVYAAAAADPAQRALWEKASTPQGYAELARAAQGPTPGPTVYPSPGKQVISEGPASPGDLAALGLGPSGPTPGSPPVTDVSLPPALPAGQPRLPGLRLDLGGATPGSPPVTDTSLPAALPIPQSRQPGLMLDLGGAGAGQPPGAASVNAPPSDMPNRRLSDDDLNALGLNDVGSVVMRNDLTNADRLALNRRIDELTSSLRASPGSF
jgi:hypothetical protein